MDFLLQQRNGKSQAKFKGTIIGLVAPDTMRFKINDITDRLLYAAWHVSVQ
jgi:hypothetical protein